MDKVAAILALGFGLILVIRGIREFFEGMGEVTGSGKNFWQRAASILLGIPLVLLAVGIEFWRDFAPLAPYLTPTPTFSLPFHFATPTPILHIPFATATP